MKHFLTICWKKYNWNKVVIYYLLCDDAELLEKISFNEWLLDDQNYCDIVVSVVWLWLKGPLLKCIKSRGCVRSKYKALPSYCWWNWTNQTQNKDYTQIQTHAFLNPYYLQLCHKEISFANTLCAYPLSWFGIATVICTIIHSTTLWFTAMLLVLFENVFLFPEGPTLLLTSDSIKQRLGSAALDR